MEHLATKTGASVENLSALSKIARISGTDIGQLETNLIRLSKALAGGDEETKGAGHALEFLGLKAKELREIDPAEALETLCGLGIERLLTSGQRNSALEGVECIASLVKQSAGRIVILAGGGVNAQTLPAILAGSGVSEVHFSARKSVESPMQYRNPGTFMGKAYSPDEYIRKQTEAGLIRQVMEAAEGSAGR